MSSDARIEREAELAVAQKRRVIRSDQWRDDRHNAFLSTDPNTKGIVWRLDPGTLEREPVAELVRPGHNAQYVSRGAIDRNGDLFFGHVGPSPVGLFKMHMPEDRKKPDAHLPLRMWG